MFIQGKSGEIRARQFGYPVIKPIRVGLIVIATNKYIQFAKPLYDSMQKYFLNKPDVERTMFLFTNQPAFRGPVIIRQNHEPWPYMTLKRYEIFYSHKLYFNEMDYLFYCDVDMLFVDKVGREIFGERVATCHPGFWNTSRQTFPYETNPQSTAYIGPHEGNRYFAGGFIGGARQKFLEMARSIAMRINEDLSRGYIAVWHDESHLNRYLIDYPPTQILNPAFCFPEADWAQNLPFSKILVALDKNHEELRR